MSSKELNLDPAASMNAAASAIFAWESFLSSLTFYTKIQNTKDYNSETQTELKSKTPTLPHSSKPTTKSQSQTHQSPPQLGLYRPKQWLQIPNLRTPISKHQKSINPPTQSYPKTHIKSHI